MFSKNISDLIRMDIPDDVLNEVHVILKLISAEFNTTSATVAFSKTLALFNGTFPGYRACNTEYHDLGHTLNTFLAIARLIHGAVVQGQNFTERQVVLGLIAALFHDAGYIQETGDEDGTGAKYTAIHEKRSMQFVERQGTDLDLSEKEIPAVQAIILCTDLSEDASSIHFASQGIGILGKFLGTADLLAQMADRIYLEKLLLLYHEFREANICEYENELDLLRKTLRFYEVAETRLKTTLDGSDKYMADHFASRWAISENLYHLAVKKQKNFMEHILNLKNSDPRIHLKRNGIVRKVRSKYGEDKRLAT